MIHFRDSLASKKIAKKTLRDVLSSIHCSIHAHKTWQRNDSATVSHNAITSVEDVVVVGLPNPR